MGWEGDYAQQIQADLHSIREAVGDKVNPLEKRLGRPTVHWGDFYECHVLGVLARARLLLDIEVASEGGKFDALLGCGDQRVASEVATKVPDDFWPYAGFEDEVEVALGDWKPTGGYCVVLHSKPVRSSVPQVLEALRTVDDMRASGETLARPSRGQGIRLTENYAEFIGHPLIEAIQFEDNGGVYFLYGSGAPSKPSLAVRLRGKLADKLHQLPDDGPSMFFVGTVLAGQVFDVVDIAFDPRYPLFRQPGFDRLAAVAWVNVGSSPINSWTKPCVVDLASGLTRSFLLVRNRHSPEPLSRECARALSEAFCG